MKLLYIFKIYKSNTFVILQGTIVFIIKNKKFTIFCGDAQHAISINEVAQRKMAPVMRLIADLIQTKSMVFLRQEHGVQGRLIELTDEYSYFFQSVGDYLITQKKNCGLGIVTADCLPIILYDPLTHTASIIHAGWKGLVSEIFQMTLQDMMDKIGVLPKNLQIYLGPAARPCCYEVQQDFIDQFAQYRQYFDDFFTKRDDKTYFDSRAFVLVIARNLGIEHEKIYTRYNVCTICDQSFCSYRREKEKARRQITIICLH